jgi:hypothetical protein
MESVSEAARAKAERKIVAAKAPGIVPHLGARAFVKRREQPDHGQQRLVRRVINALQQDSRLDRAFRQGVEQRLGRPPRIRKIAWRRVRKARFFSHASGPGWWIQSKPRRIACSANVKRFTLVGGHCGRRRSGDAALPAIRPAARVSSLATDEPDRRTPSMRLRQAARARASTGPWRRTAPHARSRPPSRWS